MAMMMSETNRLSVQQHAERILQVDMSMRDNVFQKAEYIGIAVDELDATDEQQNLATKLAMSKGTLSKWKTIAKNTTIHSNRDSMPASLNALYNLATFEKLYDERYGKGKGAKRLQTLISKGQISLTTEVSEAANLVKGVQKAIREKKKNENEEKKENLLEVDDSITNPKSLEDFIGAGKLFNLFVVLPTKKQLAEWNKLDFSVDIGDAFPLHELRKSADTSSVYCFLKIPRKQFPLGIKCLDGWGFNYLDFSTLDDDLIVIGKRGQSKDFDVPRSFSNLNEVYSFASSKTKEPYILVGDKKPPNNVWSVCYER